MIVECRLRDYRGDRTLRALEQLTGINKGLLSMIEAGRLLPRDRDIAALEQAYGHARSEWYPDRVAAVLVDETSHELAMVSEVWMPRSGQIRVDRLEIHEISDGDAVRLYSKGHHDAGEFLVAAAFAALDVVTPQVVRHEWWATRVIGDMTGLGESYYRRRVAATAKGAYPVTVVDL